MDLRKEKTERWIKSAFLELRAARSLEKIRVKDLCDLAQINKSTFYAHYQDIYDLSDRVQAETVGKIMELIANDPEFTVADTAAFTRSLFNAILAHSSLIDVLFSGKEQGALVGQLEKGIKELVYREYPSFREDLEKQVILTYTIYGGYCAYRSYQDRDDTAVFRTIEKISGIIQPMYAQQLG